MKRIIGALLVLVLASFGAAAQKAQIDSLQHLLAQHPELDAERVHLLISMVRYSGTVDPFKAEPWADEAVGIARTLKDGTLTARALIAKVAIRQAQYALQDDSAAIGEAFALDPTFGGTGERAIALRIKHINDAYAGRTDGKVTMLEEAYRLAREAGDRREEARCLVLMVSELMATDRLAADSCMQQAIALMTAHGTKGELAELIGVEGNALLNDGKSKLALERFDLAARTAEEGGAVFQLTLWEDNKGYAYWNLGNYPLAMDLMVKALRKYEALGYKDGTCATENNVGCLYREMNDHANALQHFRRSYEIAVSIGSTDRIIAGLNDIGGEELAQGDARSALVKFTEALRLSPQVERTFGTNGMNSRLAESNRNIGMAKAALGDIPGASAAFEASMRISDEGGLQLDAATTRTRYADALRKATPPRPERAGQLYEQVNDSAAANGWLNLQRDALNGLYEVHQLLGDVPGALRYLKEYLVVKDSLLSADKARAISNLQIQYDTERKEQQIVLLGKEKEVQQQEIEKQKLVRNGFIGGFAFVGLFAMVFFVQRNRISKARKRSDELLLNILPEEVADELKHKGEADAKHFDAATILFTDFKGFTAVSEKLSPQDLVAELNTCFKAFDNIITARGIEKIKTIGDAYMCAGGLPDPRSSSPADVVYAALEMQAFMKARKAERDALDKPAFEMRVGIHTGPVVAGIVGVKKFQYDIWGDTVNTANRMESSGEVGQVNISEATYALVKDEMQVNRTWRMANGEDGPTHSPTPIHHSPSPAFTFTPSAKVQAKGKGEMEMYFVDLRQAD